MSFLLNPFRFTAAAPSGLQADPGAFVLTGNDVALKRSLFMSAAAGSFALTGNAVGLSAGRKLAADPGVFALTGQDAGLKRALRMDAGAGSFALTGNAATLTYSGSAANDPNFANVVLLCGFDGADGATAATDASNSAHTLTFAGNAQIDTAESKFGGSSLLLDGSGDYVTIPHSSDFIFDADFTIELWARAIGQSKILLSKYNTGSNLRSWEILMANNDDLNVLLSSAGTSANLNLVGTADLDDGNWHHIAVDRSGSTVRLYVDGVRVASGTFSGSVFNNNTIPLYIGARDATAANQLPGHIDEIRITKGVARYASDSGFTVPTAAYPRS